MRDIQELKSFTLDLLTDHPDGEVEALEIVERGFARFHEDLTQEEIDQIYKLMDDADVYVDVVWGDED